MLLSAFSCLITCFKLKINNLPAAKFVRRLSNLRIVLCILFQKKITFIYYFINFLYFFSSRSLPPKTRPLSPRPRPLSSSSLPRLNWEPRWRQKCHSLFFSLTTFTYCDWSPLDSTYCLESLALFQIISVMATLFSSYYWWRLHSIICVPQTTLKSF